MEYVPLGRTGLRVSRLCLGTMNFGPVTTPDDSYAVMDHAHEQGINFFDTAELYPVTPAIAETQGDTERFIGTWFKKSGKRKDIVLATKVSGPGRPWIRNGAALSRKEINHALEMSLERLQTDYIDLYQLHWPNRGSYHFTNLWNYAPQFDPKQVEDNFIEVLETMNDLVKVGKIRHVGLSNETAWGKMKYLRLSEERKLPRMVSIQNEYSLLCRLFEPDLSEVAMAENIGLLAWSPLATGMLSGKYLNGARPEGSRWTLLPNRSPRDTEAAAAAIRAYMNIAKKYGLDICQMALAFVNMQPFVTSNIIGATTMDQLKTDIASINVKLSDEVLAEIDGVRRFYAVPY